MNSTKNIARGAGIGYLVIFISGIFANFFVLENLFIPTDAEATVRQILASDFLFRSGIFSFIIMVIFDAFLAWALYILLIPVNKQLSLFTAWLRLVNAAIFAIALGNLFGVLDVLNNADFLKVFETGHLYVQVMLLLKNFNNTWLIGLIFFGLHLFLLGYLIYKSNYIPKIIGVLLIIASVGYLTDSFAGFLFSGYSDYKDIFSYIVIIPGIIGELSFTFWLLFNGEKIPELKEEK